jgi:YD repeat-containing protein
MISSRRDNIKMVDSGLPVECRSEGNCRHFFLMASLALSSALCVGAEEIQGQEPPVLSAVMPGAWSLAWSGVVDRTYFIQTSFDLHIWNYQPVMVFGDGTWLTNLGSTSPRYFVRLVYVDDYGVTTLQQAKDADFDNDGIPNNYEVVNLFSDPLDKESAGGDADGDGLPDGWELFYFGNTNTADANAILQPDGLSNKDKADLGLDPNKDYSAATVTEPSSFTYDPVGRLTGVTAPVGSGSYTPDEEGNLTEAR